MPSTTTEPASGDSTDELRSPALWRPSRRRLALVSIVAAGLMLVLTVRALVAEPYSVSASSAESMKPQMRAGDRVLVAKLGSVQRGDLAVVSVSQGWPVAGSAKPRHTLWEQTLRPAAQALGVDSTERSIVVRIVARGGDTVVCCNGRQVRVNGEAVGSQLPATAAPFTMTVPRGRYFVLSDNPAAANDSRVRIAPTPGTGASDGTIAADAVVGVVIARVWPPSRLGGIPQPPAGDA